ncbi:MAG: TetR/AcrR family transcriptional regulator [Azospirillaceae bacterium]|nr:TetR/AcrR family transcriptional regulator [Azospirillaceae bacterium]
MTTHTHGSAAKRAAIEDSAAVLFAAHGYEQTSLQAVAKAAGAAMGSLSHYFGGKATLAARVYAAAADRLIASIEAVPRPRRSTPSDTVREVVKACLDWEIAYPRDRKLISALAPQVVETVPPSIPLVEIRLGAILATWVRPFVDAHKMRPLTPWQLYALMIAPALCVVDSGPAGPGDEGDSDPADWLGCLTDAALAGVALPPASSVKTKCSKRATPRPEDPGEFTLS